MYTSIRYLSYKSIHAYLQILSQSVHIHIHINKYIDEYIHIYIYIYIYIIYMCIYVTAHLPPKTGARSC